MMNPEQLLAAFERNAERKGTPKSVEIEGIGTVFVRLRTVKEFEEMAQAEPDKQGDEGPGRFALALARMLCDESGNRYPLDIQSRLADLLARQPERVFRQITEAADAGEKAPEDSAGN